MTLRVLRAGAAFVSGLFVTALVLRLIGNDAAEPAASLGVAALIGTTALAMLATVVERWEGDRHTAALALAVLGILGVATVVAFATP